MSFAPFKYLNARQEFRLTVVTFPQYHPQVGTNHDGDTGAGHTVTWYDVPRMGPNRRATTGAAMTFDGSRSWTRGGGAASGHSWHAFRSDSEVLGSGDEVASGSGSTWDFTPPDDGTYRVELRLANRASDGSTDGARFVRAFSDGWAGDLEESTQLSGNFSVDTGGYEVTITYKPSGDGDVVADWARVVVNVDTYFSDGNPTLDNRDTNDSQGPGMTPSVTFNGIVLGDTIVENRLEETVTFRLVSPSYALQKIPQRGYPVTITSISESGSFDVPAEFPLMYSDPTQLIAMPDGTSLDAVAYVRQIDPTFPVHEITGMTFSDPIIHLLQRHTNFMQWFDVDLEQESATYRFPYAMGEGNIYAQLKKFQDARLGNLFCDKKGTLHFARDVRFQDDTWWADNAPTPLMTFDREYSEDIQIDNAPFKVAQVTLSGVNDQNQPFVARYPDTPDTIGEIMRRTSLIVFDLLTLQTWAQRMYVTFNQPYAVQVTAMGMNRGLEINDVVGVDYTDQAGIRSV